MTPETVLCYYRAYKFFYKAKAPTDLEKYVNIPVPSLFSQHDRHFYYRISQKLNDDTIHALFIGGFFYQPDAYIAALATPEAFEKAMLFAGRAENGDTLLQHDLYELRKTPDIKAWLYGTGHSMPPVIQDLIAGDFPIDLACILLLVSQPDLDYHWLRDIPTDDTGLGTGPWVDRLKKADRLISFVRPAWRLTAQRISKEFWHSLGIPSLAPVRPHVESSLF